MHTEDGYFIQKCLAGESQAFSYLVDKYKSAIYSHAYSMVGNFHDAEDMAQEAFIKAYQKLGSLKRWDRFLAWLYSITANLCNDFLRAQSRQLESASLENTSEAALAEDTNDTHQKHAAYETLDIALAKLPQMYRQVLSLYYLGGMRGKEIAKYLGTSEANVNKRLSRARSQLKEEMLSMMGSTFDEMKLQPAFTFRIAEAIKQTRIQAPPSKMTLPLSVSATVGLIALLLSLSVPSSPLYRVGQLIGSALPSQTQVLDKGEIAVDTIQVDRIITLSPTMDDGDFGKEPLPEPARMFGGGRWEKKNDLPRGVAGHATGVVNGEIYITGGVSGFAAVSSIVYAYDPVTNTVTPKASMQSARAAHVSSTVNGKMYIIGGVTFPGGQVREVATVEMYDPTVNTWEIVSEIPTSRGLPTSCSVNGKIYVIGGFDLPNGVVPHQNGHLFEALGTVEVYDPIANQWQQKTDMPTARFGHSCAVVEGRIYVIGGSAQGLVPVAAVEMYDPVADRWEQVTELPTLRSHFSSESINGKIYAIGGENFQTSVLYSTVEVYDPDRGTWTQGGDLPAPRMNLRTAAINGNIYAIAGQELGGLLSSTIEEFTPDIEAPQSVSPTGKLPTTWGEEKATQ